MMESDPLKPYSTSDGIILLLLSLCISTALYHPYYFGDELFSFAFGMRHDGEFWGTFSELNAYKPRVLMNLIWAAIVAGEVPRWGAMFVNASAMTACAILVYRIGTRNLGATRGAALFAALLLLGSRFGAMLYYDYVSGTVETISLALFLAGLSMSADAVFDGKVLPWRRLIAAIACLLLAVTVHERFVAGLAGAMAVVSLFWVKRHWAQKDARGLIFPVLGVVLPAIAVVLLVKTLSPNPLTMGTSGQTVQVSGGTLQIAATYLQNVFLGSNFGPVWFVGSLNQHHPWAVWVFRISAILLALGWIVPWLLRGRPSIAKGDNGIRYQAIAVLCAFIVGMVLVASLPGADRQEARWMFPVFAALLLLILATYRSRARAVLLLLLALSQAFYLAYGSPERIASINASLAAKQLGRAMDSVDFPGDAGVMVAVPEPDTSWVLGGADGQVFCRVNLSKRNCLFSFSAASDSAQAQAEYGFGLTPQGANRRGEAYYRYVPRAQVAAMLGSTVLPQGGDVIGHGATWSDWTFNPASRTERGLVLAGLAENFYRLEAKRLDGKFLVYRAEPLEGERVPMRIQVNWHDASNGFLGAFIDVVDVSGPVKDYPALIIAPENAAYGLVYATLHDGAVGKVRLESVRVVDLSDAAPSAAAPPAGG
jgi:hypothetical protein